MHFNFQDDLILEDDRVKIQPMKEEDKGFFMEFLLDPDLNTYSVMQINNARDAIKYVDACLEDRQNQKRYPFIFFDKRSQEYAGTSCYGNISNDHKRLEIGWTKIGNNFQGTGLNVHAKFLMLQYGFETLGCNRMELKTHSENIRSRKAMEKIGAKFEGMLRQHMVMPDGSLRDSVYYSILRSEWREVAALLKSYMVV